VAAWGGAAHGGNAASHDGAGPYGLSTAAFALEHAVETLTVGHPMSFWREHMPEGMFLRSGVD